MSAATNDALIRQQQKTMEKLTDMLHKSSSALMCGPECQKNAQVDNLRQAYLNAMTTSQKAPTDISVARKKYIIADQGEARYNSIVEKELEDKATYITGLMTDNLNTGIEYVSTLNTYYNSELINNTHIKELYNEYKKKNARLSKELKQSNADILTNDRKTYYEIQGIDVLEWWGAIFIWIYYILVAVIAITIMFGRAAVTTMHMFIGLFFAVLYPFIVGPVARFIYRAIVYIGTLSQKNIYKTL